MGTILAVYDARDISRPLFTVDNVFVQQCPSSHVFSIAADVWTVRRRTLDQIGQLLGVSPTPKAVGDDKKPTQLDR